jgi:DNA-binding winged helix-turn-helix (wHTH) protein
VAPFRGGADSPRREDAAQRLVKFGAFEFDLGSGELRRAGRTVALQGQPAQILARLLSRPGELVTRDDLRRGLWADDTFIEFDAALNVAINKVRQALGDSAAAPRFIETLPKCGYRFLADVRQVDQTESSEAVPAAAPTASVPQVPWRRWRVAGACLVLLLIVRRGTETYANASDACAAAESGSRRTASSSSRRNRSLSSQGARRNARSHSIRRLPKRMPSWQESSSTSTGMPTPATVPRAARSSWTRPTRSCCTATR